jgi:hypothetical protein
MYMMYPPAGGFLNAFEVFTAVVMKIAIIRGYNDVYFHVNRCTLGTYRLHLQDRKGRQQETIMK